MQLSDTIACEKCGKVMTALNNFYRKRDGEYCSLCKKCLTMHVNNFKEETYTWILRELDFPFIPELWNSQRDELFAQNPNLKGTSVLGRYIAKMRLNQYNKYGWNDSELLRAKDAEKKVEAEQKRKEHEEKVKEQYENGEITEAEYKTIMNTTTLNQERIETEVINAQEVPEVYNPYGDYNAFMDESELPSVGESLTEEEKIYLAVKWGRLYKPEEWVELEKTYTEMTNSFDIQDADTINTLILICKTNLKMNQALDTGNIEEYQKLSRVSNELRKSAKFTAAQKKEDKTDFVDSVGELVAYCEKYGGAIPKYEVTVPQDIVDKVINDMKSYTRELIYEDKSLAKQVEDQLRKIELAKQHKEDIRDASSKGLDAIEINDQDIIDYNNYVAEQRELDNEIMIGKGAK